MSFGHYVRLGRVTTEHAIARLEGLLAITEKLETFRAAQLFLRSKVWAHFTLPRGKRVGNFNKPLPGSYATCLAGIIWEI